jgi:ABC-type multidrug transport system fused ATPase/permease subunit
LIEARLAFLISGGTGSGKIAHMAVVFAELERDFIRMRTREALQVKKENGVKRHATYCVAATPTASGATQEQATRRKAAVGGTPSRRGDDVAMPDASNGLEAAKLVNDWAKWLVTIETAAIALLGVFFTGGGQPAPDLAKVLGTLSIGTFLVSIAAAAMLLLTLPEITQNLRHDQNIWLTRDTVAGRLLRLNTQGFALIESVFFGVGLILMGATMVVLIWA